MPISAALLTVPSSPATSSSTPTRTGPPHRLLSHLDHLLKDTDSVKVPKSIETLDHNVPTSYRAHRREARPSRYEKRSIYPRLIAYEMLTGASHSPPHLRITLASSTKPASCPAIEPSRFSPRHVEHCHSQRVSQRPDPAAIVISRHPAWSSRASSLLSKRTQHPSSFSSPPQPAITSFPYPLPPEHAYL